MEFSSEENILLSTVQAGDQTQQKEETNMMQGALSNCFVGRGMVTLTYRSLAKFSLLLFQTCIYCLHISEVNDNFSYKNEF